MRLVSFFAVAVGIAVTVQGALAAEEVWRSDVRIDKPTELRGKDLFIRPGVKITFAGNGSLHLLDSSLRCAHVTFESDSVVTNDFRLHVHRGRIEFRDCLFRNIRAVNPAGKHFIQGGICVSEGPNSRIEHCTFVNCSSVMATNAHGMEVERNLAVGGDTGFSLLQCRDVRLAGNEFHGLSGVGLKLSNVLSSELFMNRFTACATGVRLYVCRDVRLIGNAFFEGREGLVCQDCGEGIVESGNRFEAVRTSVRKFGSKPKGRKK